MKIKCYIKVENNVIKMLGMSSKVPGDCTEIEKEQYDYYKAILASISRTILVAIVLVIHRLAISIIAFPTDCVNGINGVLFKGFVHRAVQGASVAFRIKSSIKYISHFFSPS